MAEQLKTGTTTVGVLTSEGVILAADRRATTGNYIANKHLDKVFKVAENLVLTMAGSVSDAQLLMKLIKAELQLKKLKTGRDATVREAANLLGGMVYRNIRGTAGISHFLLGGKDNEGFHLFDLYPDGSVIEIDEFVSSGSGSVITWGVLETSYDQNMNLKAAQELVIKAINAAVQRDSASGGGVTLFTITDKGVEQKVEKVVGVDLTQ